MMSKTVNKGYARLFLVSIFVACFLLSGSVSAFAKRGGRAHDDNTGGPRGGGAGQGRALGRNAGPARGGVDQGRALGRNAGPAGPAARWGAPVHPQNRELQHDRKEVRGDRRDLRHDQREIGRDRKELRNDLKNGNFKEARKDKKELREDLRERNEDRQELREDREERREDRRDRRDNDNNPPGPMGGRGTNWENPPGPAGGSGASPDRPGSDFLKNHPRIGEKLKERFDKNNDGRLEPNERREARQAFREKIKDRIKGEQPVGGEAAETTSTDGQPVAGQ